MNTELKGHVLKKGPVETFGKFEKLVFWVKQPDTEKYPQTYQLEVHGKGIGLLSDVNVGDLVTCSINIQGRYYNKNNKEGVINTLQCWKIVAEPISNVSQKTYTSSIPAQEDYADDLPF